jgi:hypothetical protein
MDGWRVLVQVGGTPAVLHRYTQELEGTEFLAPDRELWLWPRVREFTPMFLAENPNGAVVRISTTLTGVGDPLAESPGPAVARGANGIVYRYFAKSPEAALNGRKGVVEFAGADRKPGTVLWPSPGGDFDLMKRIKQLFDPNHLLNPGRLYGRL